jgi:hypothetical protein
MVNFNLIDTQDPNVQGDPFVASRLGSTKLSISESWKSPTILGNSPAMLLPVTTA